MIFLPKWNKKNGQLPDLVESSFEWDGGGGGGTATVILVLSPPAERLAAWLLLKFDLNLAKAELVVGLYCFSFRSFIAFSKEHFSIQRPSEESSKYKNLNCFIYSFKSEKVIIQVRHD